MDEGQDKNEHVKHPSEEIHVSLVLPFPTLESAAAVSRISDVSNGRVVLITVSSQGIVIQTWS